MKPYEACTITWKEGPKVPNQRAERGFSLWGIYPNPGKVEEFFARVLTRPLASPQLWGRNREEGEGQSALRVSTEGLPKARSVRSLCHWQASVLVPFMQVRKLKLHKVRNLARIMQLFLLRQPPPKPGGPCELLTSCLLSYFGDMGSAARMDILPDPEDLAFICPQTSGSFSWLFFGVWLSSLSRTSPQEGWCYWHLGETFAAYAITNTPWGLFPFGCKLPWWNGPEFLCLSSLSL